MKAVTHSEVAVGGVARKSVPLLAQTEDGLLQKQAVAVRRCVPRIAGRLISISSCEKWEGLPFLSITSYTNKKGQA